MKTEVLGESKESLQSAEKILKSGGVIAFPTDTVYGVGALVSNREAISRIYAVKGRGKEKALPVMISNPSELDQVARQPDIKVGRMVEHFWPGPLTVVLQRHPALPTEISSLETVGIRVPEYRFVLDLLAAVGPMAVTSANRSGDASPTSASQVLAGLGGRIDLLIDGGTTPGDQPSTVVDCTGEYPRILRAGPIGHDAILDAWAGE
jgi:L-threonylcarbamoyladenylate synthase